MKSAKRAVLSIAVLSVLGLAQTAVAGGRQDLVLAALQAGKAQHVPGELLVQFKDGASAADQKAVLRGLGASKLQTVRGNLQLVRLPAGLAVADAVRAVGSDRVVDFAEPNWIYKHSATSNDTYVTSNQLWGMTGTFGSQAANAWSENKQDCSGVVVGVIDEGIYFNHEDLTANIWSNPNDAVDGLDNDGNGYVDDTRGWNFDGGNNNINAGGTGDDHGTHVSGTIAGVGGNGKGVAGVCWSGIDIVNARFLGRNGGTTANAIASVDYMTGLKQKGVPIVATNNSWGGGGFSQALLDAIVRANAADILFIAAAGNSGANNDTTASYPSNYDVANVIAVAALVSDGTLASYSQYGKVTVDLGAPGSGIISSVPKASKGSVISGYASYNGTSMATPHVSGAAALYKKLNPAASAAAIKAAILNGTVATPSLSNKTVTGGRLDVSGF